MSTSETGLSDCDNEDVLSKIQNKRIVNDHLYPKNIRKQVRLSDQSYANEKGVYVLAKSIETHCR